MSKTRNLADEIVCAATPLVDGWAPQPQKAFAWARVSTTMQDDRGLSIPEQLRQIRLYAEHAGIVFVAEFQEAASAFRDQSRRHEFQRMVDKAKKDPEVSVILVHDLSRFPRGSADAKQLIRKLRQHGVEVVSLNDPKRDRETVAGVYLEAITFAKNEAYSREVAFHTRKGCQANVQTRDPETGWCYKNGGQPLWGYRLERIDRGETKHGRPHTKSIWVPDETVVAGRPTHEWVGECLAELAANGASLDELRDFCNDGGIPARRRDYWSTSTRNSLLQPNVLLQHCGYGVWNVHQSNGAKRPPSEWVIVQDAHEALLSEEEARAVLAAREQRKKRGFDKGYGPSRESTYLLSGGLFVCARCGSNMMGYRRAKGQTYYVCGSQPYRKGMGCGPGVYVPQHEIETEVAEGLGDVLSRCADPDGFTRKVNAELCRLCGATGSGKSETARRLSDLDRKIANIRTAIEDGLEDATRANERIQSLRTQKEEL